MPQFYEAQTPATRDLGENDPGIPGPAPRRIMLAPIGDVDQVIRHFRALFGGGIQLLQFRQRGMYLASLTSLRFSSPSTTL